MDASIEECIPSLCSESTSDAGYRVTFEYLGVRYHSKPYTQINPAPKKTVKPLSFQVAQTAGTEDHIQEESWLTHA